MFYKFATAFACFFVLGQAMADENIAGKGKGLAEEQGPIGAVGKGAPNEQGPLGVDEGKGVGGEQGPLVDEGKDVGGEQGPLFDEGKDVGGEQGPLGPNEAGPMGGEQGPLGPNEAGPVGGEQGPAKELGAVGTAFPLATATFDDLKLACVDPARFHFQLPPGNIRIACESRETAWVPDGNSAITGDCTRTVTGQLYSNKIVIGEEQYSIAVPSNDLSCPRFKEVIKIFRSEYGTTCEEILAYSDLGHFCQERLSSDPNAIPELVVVEDTGRALDTCGANVSGGK